MAGVALPSGPPQAVVSPPRERISAWPLIDRVFYRLCWASGVGLCLIALAIVLYMFVKGIAYLKPEPARDPTGRLASPEPERRLRSTR